MIVFSRFFTRLIVRYATLSLVERIFVNLIVNLYCRRILRIMRISQAENEIKEHKYHE